MIEQPPPRPMLSDRKIDAVELRIGNLRRELEADPEPSNQAAILYEVGAVYEHELGQVSSAVDHYVQAHAISPSFQPALIAQLRITERSKDAASLASLRIEHVAAARSTATARCGWSASM